MHIITWNEDGSDYKATTSRLSEAMEVIDDLREHDIPFTHYFEE